MEKSEAGVFFNAKKVIRWIGRLMGALVLLLLLRVLLFYGGFGEGNAFEAPEGPKADLASVLEEACSFGTYRFTEEEYRFLYHQTGLGKQAVDQVLEKKDGRQQLTQIQETFFREPRYISVQDNWFSRRDQTVNEAGEIQPASQLVGLQEGDIILTKCSRVMGWNNGHAGLVVDAPGKRTLEAIVIGENTALRRYSKWEKYPNYLVLRLSGADKEERRKIARWAMENMMDIPYRLTAGFFGARKNLPTVEAEPQPITGTQCAHLIWRAYAQFGYDLDPNGGWLITPRQLANSPRLEVVQVYGMNPDDPW